MNKILSLASSLNNVLLNSNEEEYDKIANEVVHQLGKATDLANLNIDVLQNHWFGEAPADVIYRISTLPTKQ